MPELEVHRKLGRENHKRELEPYEKVLKPQEDELKLMSILVSFDLGEMGVLQQPLLQS